MNAIHPISFFPTNTLYNNESFIFITNDEVQNIQNYRYMISNFGRIYDCYTNLFVAGRLNKGIMYVDLYGENNILTVELIWLVATMFHEKTAKYPRMIDRKTKTLFHADNIEWTDNDKEERDKNIRIINGQRMHIGEGSNFPTKLTEEKVHEICKLLIEDELSLPEIGNMFNVSADAIFRIKSRQCWRHITDQYDLPKVLPRDQRLKGENNPASKYTEVEIRQICELLQEKKYTNSEISQMTNLRQGLVSKIKNHRAWLHISREYDF